ncbi:hypothetical protein PPERSA_04688 [Pseudocohnilembus persalinus]|uniref:Uncharacterized protein n=1 Tax=Pseudocohnilembus persalinus TaxID=266149 RepID=A0A0V0R4G7_PSEPJ|nr:hypothetical protein PPERSA_04688 [Pseudocohnilembus persalinus]|eukprot:KRX09382.1 hypothetical protein PPERSA_04688 [Pseudocohnilembus persalinus]
MEQTQNNIENKNNQELTCQDLQGELEIISNKINDQSNTNQTFQPNYQRKKKNQNEIIDSEQHFDKIMESGKSYTTQNIFEIQRIFQNYIKGQLGPQYEMEDLGKINKFQLQLDIQCINKNIEDYLRNNSIQQKNNKNNGIYQQQTYQGIFIGNFQQIYTQFFNTAVQWGTQFMDLNMSVYHFIVQDDENENKNQMQGQQIQFSITLFLNSTKQQKESLIYVQYIQKSPKNEEQENITFNERSIIFQKVFQELGVYMLNFGEKKLLENIKFSIKKLESNQINLLYQIPVSLNCENFSFQNINEFKRQFNNVLYINDENGYLGIKNNTFFDNSVLLTFDNNSCKDIQDYNLEFWMCKVD